MSKGLRITDHAVLRYLERVARVDVEAARAEIARKVAFAEAHEGATSVLSAGFTYSIRGGAITTVYKTHAPNPRTGGHRK